MKESISHSYSSTSIPYSTKMGRMLYFQCNIKAQLPNNEIISKKNRNNATPKTKKQKHKEEKQEKTTKRRAASSRC